MSFSYKRLGIIKRKESANYCDSQDLKLGMSTTDFIYILKSEEFRRNYMEENYYTDLAELLIASLTAEPVFRFVSNVYLFCSLTRFSCFSCLVAFLPRVRPI